jgi:RNA polymerase sigma-70 factor (ECF subfamily)
MKSDESRAGSSTQGHDSELVLQRLLHSYSSRLLSYINLQLPIDVRGVVSAQDVLQDVFFEAFQRLAEFRPQGEDSSYRWLVTIARNRVVDVVRSQRRAKRGGKRRKDQFDDVEGFLEQLAVYSRTPSQSAISHEIASSVQQSVNSLEPHYRQVISFRYLEGLTIKQTAERMGRTEGAVMMLCNRGLKALKLQMETASLLV